MFFQVTGIQRFAFKWRKYHKCFTCKRFDLLVDTYTAIMYIKNIQQSQSVN